LFLLGSNFGQSHHPAWSANLLANPDAWVTIRGKVIPVTATLLTDVDRDRAQARFLTLPIYRAHLTSTDRDFRLFALTRR
jgi:deazaflavin-dependent oxidoreductase (nitroreductase family)